MTLKEARRTYYLSRARQGTHEFNVSDRDSLGLLIEFHNSLDREYPLALFILRVKQGIHDDLFLKGVKVNFYCGKPTEFIEVEHAVEPERKLHCDFGTVPIVNIPVVKKPSREGQAVIDALYTKLQGVLDSDVDGENMPDAFKLGAFIMQLEEGTPAEMLSGIMKNNATINKFYTEKQLDEMLEKPPEDFDA